MLVAGGAAPKLREHQRLLCIDGLAVSARRFPRARRPGPGNAWPVRCAPTSAPAPALIDSPAGQQRFVSGVEVEMTRPASTTYPGEPGRPATTAVNAICRALLLW